MADGDDGRGLARRCVFAPLLGLLLAVVPLSGRAAGEVLSWRHDLTVISKRVLVARYINLAPVAGGIKNWREVRVSSPDDPGFAAGVVPVNGSYWVRTLRHSPRPPGRIVATWLFLVLDQDLTAGKTYEVRFDHGAFVVVDGATGRPTELAASPPPVAGRWDGDHHQSMALQVNQVGYLPDAPKFAYLTQYAGRQFDRAQEVDLNFAGFAHFQVLDAATRRVAIRGQLQVAGAQRQSGQRRQQPPPHRADALSKSRVWEMNFSGLRVPGRYVVEVPGVGSSLPFTISPQVYNLPLGVLCRGLWHQRCGVGLPLPWTRHAHLPCHRNDARVPANAEYRRSDLRFFPHGGERMLAGAGGHHGGSYYERAVLPTALFAFRLLLPFEVMPERLNYRACPVPESDDDVPDLLQEAKVALDWLSRMQDGDGGFFTAIRPAPELGGEDGLAGQPAGRWAEPRLVYWKDTQATAAAGAALARAARLPEFRRHWPDEAQRYREQAEKAWDFCQRQIGRDGVIRWVDGDVEGRFLGALDEVCWLAAELWFTAGHVEAHQFFLRRHRPEDGWRWRWWPLAEASGAATRTYALADAEVADPAMREACRAALFKAARETSEWQGKWAFRVSFPETLMKAGRWAWYFPAEVATYDLLLAAAVADDPALAGKFRDAALHNVSYELGNQPAGMVMITGIGGCRPTDHAHQLTRHGEVVEPIPGMPLGFPPGGFTALAGEGAPDEFAGHGETPPAYRHIDGWNREQELALPALAATVMSYAMLGDAGGQRAGFPDLNIAANNQSRHLVGSAPLTVSFRGAAAGREGKLIREWYWDLDNGDFATAPEFAYTFTAPGEYRVGCTVTDDDGWPAFRHLQVTVRPAGNSAGGE